MSLKNGLEQIHGIAMCFSFKPVIIHSYSLLTEQIIYQKAKVNIRSTLAFWFCFYALAITCQFYFNK